MENYEYIEPKSLKEAVALFAKFVCRHGRKIEKIGASTAGASSPNGGKRKAQVPESNSQSSREADQGHSRCGEK